MSTKFAKDISKEYTAEYAQYVAQERAVPNLIDGLKPSQRRCITAAYDLRLFHNKPFMKASKIEGDVMGSYHPHGGVSLAGLVQPFTMRYPLFEGQGNWGCSDDPGSVAASRYVEARLTEFTEMFYLESADHADREDNYDGRLKEIVKYYPPIPGSLLTGSQGIAVGFSTNLPTHNLTDVCNSLLAYLDKKDYMTLLPDTCEGSVIISTPEEIRELYIKGEGSIRYKAKTHYESVNGKRALVVDAFAPGYSKTRLNTAAIIEYVEKGLLELSNESDKSIRYVFQSPSLEVLEDIERRLEVSVGYRMYLEQDGKIHMYTLKELYEEFIRDRILYIVRKYHDLLAKVTVKKEYNALLINLKGDKKYLQSLFEMTLEEAVVSISQKYHVTNDVSKSVLSTPLRSLLSDNIKKLQEEIEEYERLSVEYISYINDPIIRIKMDIKNLLTQSKNDKRRATLLGEVSETIEYKIGRSRINISEKDLYLIGTPNNEVQIVSGAALKNITLTSKEYMAPMSKDYYLFYGVDNIVVVTREVMERGENKFKSDSLKGIIGLDALEKCEIYVEGRKKPHILGDWAIRQRLSSIQLGKIIKVTT